jgi:hypothetical protein
MDASSIMRRTQTYLDPRQAEELAARSRPVVTASALIREAIARYLAGPEDDAAELARQRAAIREAAGAIARLPRGAAYVAALRDADVEHDRALEERWRSR